VRSTEAGRMSCSGCSDAALVIQIGKGNWPTMSASQLVNTDLLCVATSTLVNQLFTN